MRELKISSTNAEVDITNWSVYIGGRNLNDILKENIEEGCFNAEVTIYIKEVEKLTIESNKPEQVKPEKDDINE